MLRIHFICVCFKQCWVGRWAMTPLVLAGWAAKIAYVTARVTRLPILMFLALLYLFLFLPHLALPASIHFLSPFLPNLQRESLLCPSAGLLFISEPAAAALQ